AVASTVPPTGTGAGNFKSRALIRYDGPARRHRHVFVSPATASSNAIIPGAPAARALTVSTYKGPRLPLMPVNIACSATVMVFRKETREPSCTLAIGCNAVILCFVLQIESVLENRT